MALSLRRIVLTYGAGSAGGLVNALLAWGAGGLGITTALHVAIAPALTPHLLYPRVVWGGIWGTLFLLPVSRARPLRSGFLVSLVPTLVQLLLVFPRWTPWGIAGLGLGWLTPGFVLLFNAAWGCASALALRLLE
ncbi:MAG TPA: hypothetical protein VFA95_07745 [Gammaproteobacteria bacterium]|nr:hypothetical protein [Gammaproteobacteria bacterium]